LPLEGAEKLASDINAALAAEERNCDEVLREWEKRYDELQQHHNAALAAAKADADNWFRQYKAMKCAGSTDLELELEKTEQQLGAEREKVKTLVEALIILMKGASNALDRKVAEAALAKVKEAKFDYRADPSLLAQVKEAK
jgi:hypothetical protein